MLFKYNPYKAPDPDEWLATDEGERSAMIQTWHEKKKIDLPNVIVHANFHLIVENNLALKDEVVVETMKRLLKQGLNRHEALHAIGAVFSDHFYTLMKSETGQVDDKQYYKKLKKLTAKRWKAGKW